jgi:hypothetical protein
MAREGAGPAIATAGLSLAGKLNDSVAGRQVRKPSQTGWSADINPLTQGLNGAADQYRSIQVGDLIGGSLEQTAIPDIGGSQAEVRL